MILGANDSLKDKLEIKQASIWTRVLYRSSDIGPICSGNNAAVNVSFRKTLISQSVSGITADTWYR